MDLTAEWGNSAAVATRGIGRHWELGLLVNLSSGVAVDQRLVIAGSEMNGCDHTPDSDSDLSRRRNVGAFVMEFIEVIDPFGPALGGGDCVDLSPVLSIDPLGPDVVAGAPSEVWIFRLAGGKPDAGGAFFLLLNRNAIFDEVLARTEQATFR